MVVLIVPIDIFNSDHLLDLRCWNVLTNFTYWKYSRGWRVWYFCRSCENYLRDQSCTGVFAHEWRCTSWFKGEWL